MVVKGKGKMVLHVLSVVFVGQTVFRNKLYASGRAPVFTIDITEG